MTMKANRHQLPFYFRTLRRGIMTGFTLMELLVAIVISSVVLIAATSGITTVLRSSNDLEAKTTRNTGLNRALAYIQEEIKTSRAVEKVDATTTADCDSDDIDSSQCLKLTDENGDEIYYAFEDISSGEQIWFKPAVLKRREVTGGTAGNWQVIADGLLGVNEHTPSPTCEFEDPPGTPAPIYGQDAANKGGFRFCLADDVATDNRLVQIFLYGYILSDDVNDTIEVSTITFSRTE